jgi:hypothetical protein
MDPFEKMAGLDTEPVRWRKTPEDESDALGNQAGENSNKPLPRHLDRVSTESAYSPR